ncbi:hypothetical protein [Gemmiger formicilis]
MNRRLIDTNAPTASTASTPSAPSRRRRRFARMISACVTRRVRLGVPGR